MTPREPRRPLAWSDFIYDLHGLLADWDATVYIVGGAVRDALLSRPLKDVDLVTGSSGIKLARYIANNISGAFFVLDDERDVGRALVETMHGQVTVDVAGFRGADLQADLLDRDFTLNAMAVDLRDDLNMLIDPLNGETDTLSKVIRRCNPDAIATDPIRALRAVRQAAQLKARIEPETLRDVRNDGQALMNTSPERVRDEFIKMLDLPNPHAALRVADTLGLLELVVPEIIPLRRLQQPPPHAFDAWAHTVLVVERLSQMTLAIGPERNDNIVASFGMGLIVSFLDRYRQQLREHLTRSWANDRNHRGLLLYAALLHDIGKANAANDFSHHEQIGAALAETRSTELRLSNAEVKRIVKIVRHQHRITKMTDHPSRREMYRYWRDVGDAGVDVCLLTMANYLGMVGAEFEQQALLSLTGRVRALLEAYYDYRHQIVNPPTLIDGNELMAQLNLEPGRIIGELLERIREAQAAGEVRTAEDALTLAREALSS